jgi:hypothetical protein
MDKKRWRPSRWMGGSGARRGRGSNATTGQGGRQEAVARQQAEAPANSRQWHDKMQHNNQPEWMRDNHTREQEGHNRVQGLKVVAGGVCVLTCPLGW